MSALVRDAAQKAVHETAAKGFSLQVQAYESSRPGYPVEVVSDLLARLQLQNGPKTVLDLAAGTGKFTRLLIPHAHLRVTAVEPNEAMLAELRHSLHGAEILQGSATGIPVEDCSMDAVFVAQAFHWFANEAACREIHRVLKPKAALCCLWNREDTAVPWIRSAVAELVEPLSEGAPQYFRGTWRAPFEESEWVKAAFGMQDVHSHRQFFRHSIAVTREQLWGRLLSKSYVALRPDEERERLRKDFDARLSEYDVRFDGPGGTEDVPLVLEVFMTFKQ